MQPIVVTLDPRAIARLTEWGGGPELARKLVRLFLDTSGERVDQIRTAFSGGDLRIAERGAHSLKSSAANLGATRLRDVCARLESLFSEDDVERARDLLDAFEDAYRLTMEALAATESDLA